MKKEILTNELKKDLAEISGKECPYYIYAFKARTRDRHGKKHPFLYLSNGYKERFKDKPVELIRIPLSESFTLDGRYTKYKDTPYLINFLNNNYHYLKHMWNGDSIDDEISDSIRTDWSIQPAKEYLTTELSFELTYFVVGGYAFHFYTPFWNLHCAPFIYVSNGYWVNDDNSHNYEVVRFSTNGYPISDVELRIKEEDLPKIRKFILANRDLIIKAWYGIWTNTDSCVICDELKEVWDD